MEHAWLGKLLLRKHVLEVNILLNLGHKLTHRSAPASLPFGLAGRILAVVGFNRTKACLARCLTLLTR
jgi:hypothetical protein